MHGNKGGYFHEDNRRRRKHQDTFKDILKDYSPESLDEVETYSVNLPQHGKYWDNGYEDVG
jgi:hypothetical protein